MRLSRERVNDVLTQLAAEAGVDGSDEEFDEVLNDLTHTVYDGIAEQINKQEGLS